MAYDFGKAFMHLLGGEQPDLRTPETKTIERNRIGQQQSLQAEYQNASADPNYGLGDPATRQLAEQSLMNDVMSKTGSSGSGQSGYEKNAVATALANFRISQAAQRQKSLSDLRTGMLQAGQGWQQPMGQPVAGVGQKFAENIAGRGASALGNKLFGEDPNDTQNKNNAAAQAGNQVGGNGFRVAPPGQPGGQSGGNGNTQPMWGV